MNRDAKSMSLRVGHGFDLHRLKRGGRLMLCGIVAAEDMSAVAHSDGDVAIHALVDAILGALGRDDIGRMFPDTDVRWKGASSSIFLERALCEVRRAGMRVVNADLTILARRPRIDPLRARMRDAIESLVGAPVNIKAGTNEGCDAVGRGAAIAAHAVVLLAKASGTRRRPAHTNRR